LLVNQYSKAPGNGGFSRVSKNNSIPSNASKSPVDFGTNHANHARSSLPFLDLLLELKLRFSISWSVEGVTPLKCAICGKAPHYGNVVSHANNTRRRRWNPNLKRVRAVVDGVRKQIRVCTACIRLGRVKKAA
jgi:large subunit ribosomal protein L28